MSRRSEIRLTRKCDCAASARESRPRMCTSSETGMTDTDHVTRQPNWLVEMLIHRRPRILLEWWIALSEEQTHLSPASGPARELGAICQRADHWQTQPHSVRGGDGPLDPTALVFDEHVDPIGQDHDRDAQWPGHLPVRVHDDVVRCLADRCPQGIEGALFEAGPLCDASDHRAGQCHALWPALEHQANLRRRCDHLKRIVGLPAEPMLKPLRLDSPRIQRAEI